MSGESNYPMLAFNMLPFNVEDLINARTIEGNRIEFKSTWSEPVKDAVIRSVCAFANDLLNLNGGYILIGFEDIHGKPVIPPHGLEEFDLESIQKEIRGKCRRIQPEYQPVLFPVYYQNKPILIIRAPGGDNRPYMAPEKISKKNTDFHYYIRQGPETVKAQGELMRQLMELAAKIPHDDRRNPEARIEDISPMLVRRFLFDVGSSLSANNLHNDERELYRRLRIVSSVNSHEVPRNAGLLFFNEDPDKFFPGARVEVVNFDDDAGGNFIEERIFKGPLPLQIKNALDYLDSLGGAFIRKIRGQAEAERIVPFPYAAMEEAIVNAVYHRSYNGPYEPVKVYIYPDRMEITSYPGPMPGIELKHFYHGHYFPQVPARNRRIGDFLKELRLAEGRGTGIPKIKREMQKNGSPEAIFDFDEQRTYFRVILPVHPRYREIHAIRETAQLWVAGDKKQALEHLKRAYSNSQGPPG